MLFHLFVNLFGKSWVIKLSYYGDLTLQFWFIMPFKDHRFWHFWQELFTNLFYEEATSETDYSQRKSENMIVKFSLFYSSSLIWIESTIINYFRKILLTKKKNTFSSVDSMIIWYKYCSNYLHTVDLLQTETLLIFQHLVSQNKKNYKS